jgi:hypothetical protein
VIGVDGCSKEPVVMSGDAIRFQGGMLRRGLQNVEEGGRHARRRSGVGKAARRLSQKAEKGTVGSRRWWSRAACRPSGSRRRWSWAPTGVRRKLGNGAERGSVVVVGARGGRQEEEVSGRCRPAGGWVGGA